MIKQAILLTIVAVTVVAADAKSQSGSKSRAANQLGAKLGTDHQFNPLNVHGKIQSPSEGLVVVENEKLVGDILDYRKSYADRIESTRRTEARK